MTHSVCRLIVSAASLAVPAGARDTWRREWLAEVDYAWAGRIGLSRRATLTTRAMSAFAHAWWLRRQVMNFEGIAQDVRFAMRVLMRQRGFSAVAVLTLAIGIGANTAIFSFVNRTLLAPLPFAQPERLMQVWETVPSMKIDFNTPALDTIDTWKTQGRTAEEMAIYTTAIVNLTGNGGPERVMAARASANLLPVMGAKPLIGTGFSADEDRYGGSPAVLLTYKLWKRRFGGDSSIVGQQITVDGKGARVAGVLPEDFSLALREVDLWVPLALAPTTPRKSRMFFVMARARSGITAADMQRDLDRAMHAEGPGKLDEGIGVNVQSMDESLRGDVRPELLLIFAVSAAVLLIACTNVTAMVLSRGLARRREIAVRISLGAGRGRLVRLLLVESVMLGAVGAAAGVVVAMMTLGVIRALMPASLGLTLEGGIDATALAFASALSIAAAAFVGLLPVISAIRSPLTVSSRSESTEAWGSRLTRRVLVTIEMALAVMLLAATALLLRGFASVVSAPLGFSTAHVLTAEVTRAGDATARTQFFEQLMTSLKSAPGVESVGAINGLPLRFGGGGSGFKLDQPGPETFVNGQHRIIAGDFFSAIQMPIRRGNTFTGRERDADAPVAVVSESFATAAWGAADPIGRRFQWGNSGPFITVIGVVGDIRVARTVPAGKNVYFPFLQVPNYQPSALTIRTAGDPGAFAASLRDIVKHIDPNQPLADVLTFDRVLWNSVGRRRFTLSLMAAFAGIALVLAAIGIYGVLSYSVGRRRLEIGVRLAIGATTGQVRAGVLREGLALSIIGAVIGLAASSAVTKWAASSVPGLTAPEPLAMIAAATLLVIVAAIACDVPARRASRIDPASTLRG